MYECLKFDGYFICLLLCDDLNVIFLMDELDVFYVWIVLFYLEGFFYVCC